MTFGDGDTSRKPFTSLDVVAHEMAHGLTFRTADLVHSGESGALDEATSDIFGALVEFAADNPVDEPDYLVGETTGPEPLRFMDEPTRNVRSVSCWTPSVKDLDVHRSSGVASKFFYRLAVGSGSTRWGSSRAAADLYGADSAERSAVQAAWLAVGVDGSGTVPPSDTTPVIDPIQVAPAHLGTPVQQQLTGRDPQG